MDKGVKIIISGGGTGGHIFPAVSIANAIKELCPEAQILFVGAKGRMEMQRVPEAGYQIEGLPIRGLKRPLYSPQNIGVAIDYLKSKMMVKKIIKNFQPDVAVGVGGYASSATLDAAHQMGIPCLIQEQNSYAGVTNKLLGKKADKICVAYDDMDRFFPAEKIIKTGNPVRQNLLETKISKKEAIESFGLDSAKKTILFVGGSLGARTINESILQHLDILKENSDVQVIWQTGKYYYEKIRQELEGNEVPNLKVMDFISDMGAAYTAADLVVSRAGASSISEFCLIGKPVILVPSPNVAEDHQTKNAMALVNKEAALYVKDSDAPEQLLLLAVDTVKDGIKLKSLAENVRKLGLPDSAKIIAQEVVSLIPTINYQRPTSQMSKPSSLDVCHDEEVALCEAKNYQLYFVGIGGIGMSALARYFKQKGQLVAGYDKTPSELTRQLEKEGILIHYVDNVDAIPEECKDPKSTLVVYTPAIPEEHTELQYFRNNGFKLEKRAQVLGELTKTHKGLCVAGTHGKTTTSTMAAHILHQSSIDCNAFLGGISKNYGTNYILSDKSDYVVIEADEFDRSFHWLRPFITVITATDPDHLDIYGTKEAYLESFRHYTTLIQEGGALIIHKDLEMKDDIPAGVKRYEYSLNEGDFHAENIIIDNGEITFDFISPLGNIEKVQLGQPVPVNVENAVAAMAMAQMVGCSSDEIKSAIASYAGVQRRFDFKIRTPKVTFLSDYAHHPKEIYQSANSLRQLYKDKKITAIFQPHLYTRTRDFYKEFADSLSVLDKVVLCDIYPAREEPIEGVTSKLIYDNLKEGVEKEMIKKDEVLDYVRNNDFEVLVILGAGDLDNMAPEITEILKEKYNI